MEKYMYIESTHFKNWKGISCDMKQLDSQFFNF